MKHGHDGDFPSHSEVKYYPEISVMKHPKTLCEQKDNNYVNFKNYYIHGLKQLMINYKIRNLLERCYNEALSIGQYCMILDCIRLATVPRYDYKHTILW